MDKLMKKSASLPELRRGEAKEAKKIYPLSAAEYELLEEIGHGAGATVYRALCIPLKEVVAIKSLDLERCNSNLDDIRREANTMQLILHPNVVRAYCSFVVDQSLRIVMPYFAGGSCLNVMKIGYPNGFDEPVIATVLKETLKALDYLHKQGHIHRDVKAGNILMDGQGRVKLGDFGVSACMFDSGDRQRLRNTFVGTPCWMAPEVMEQIHGYNFKADIWSFGITALELAHGHAPFSTYPPMKVLLMTLHEAPPTLDDQRDKRFSKSFKEMIAMCLVKDPTKRPTAEKLLKHTFFKNARSSDYIAKRVLEGLPPLGQRVMNLKFKDAARLAKMRMPSEEKEEKSQSEYKRGVSCWNFDVEDLIAKTALLTEDDCSPSSSMMVKHQLLTKDDCSPSSSVMDKHQLPQSGAVDSFCNVVAAGNAAVHPKNDHLEGSPEPTQELRDEATHRDNRQRSVASSSVSQPTGQLITSESGAGISNQPLEDGKGQALKIDRESHKLEKGEKLDLEKQTDDGPEDHGGRLLHDKNLASPDLRGLRIRDKDKDVDYGRVHRVVSDVEVSRSSKFYQDRKLAASSGALAERGLSDRINDVPLARRSSSYMDVREDKVKRPLLQKRQRFSIISEAELVPQSSPSFPSISTSMELSQRRNVVQPNAVHHDRVINDLTSSISAADGSNGQRSSHGMSRIFSRTSSEESTDSDFGFQICRVEYVAELQNRISDLDDELMQVKLKNIQLEHQLSVMRNDEEKHIRKEGSAMGNR